MGTKEVIVEFEGEEVVLYVKSSDSFHRKVKTMLLSELPVLKILAIEV